MLACDAFLVVALLTAPAGSSEPAGLQSLYSSLRRPLQTLAVQWEILDPREVRYILARQEDFASDLNLLRRRYQELRHHDESPQLPAGYSTMVLLALVPPLWRRVMDPRVPRR